ncbi:hypothetical protein V493_06078 [Pseudogymnoascus sp. VKM F-4281 (FW-2241)]|nr:hypothetical protein V493_06078 [Pseudogymnoascus sp. VKM F-4281 (FW-2241)]
MLCCQEQASVVPWMYVMGSGIRFARCWERAWGVPEQANTRAHYCPGNVVVALSRSVGRVGVCSQLSVIQHYSAVGRAVVLSPQRDTEQYSTVHSKLMAPETAAGVLALADRREMGDRQTSSRFLALTWGGSLGIPMDTPRNRGSTSVLASITG